MMKSKLPKPLAREINRLASEEMRTPTLDRAKALRQEYQTRLMSGESLDALSSEVRRRAARITVNAMCRDANRSAPVSTHASEVITSTFWPG